MSIYFDENGGPYVVSRELFCENRGPSAPLINNDSYSFKSFADAFEFFEKLYKMDKASFDAVKNSWDNLGYTDESKHAGFYTFTLHNRFLSVKIHNFQEIAKEAFALYNT